MRLNLKWEVNVEKCQPFLGYCTYFALALWLCSSLPLIILTILHLHQVTKPKKRKSVRRPMTEDQEADSTEPDRDEQEIILGLIAR